MKKRKPIYISIIYIVAIALVCSFEYWLLLEKHYLFSDFIFPVIVNLACILIAYILSLFKKIKLIIIDGFFFENFVIVTLLEYYLLEINWDVVLLCMGYLMIALVMTVDSFEYIKTTFTNYLKQKDLEL